MTVPMAGLVEASSLVSVKQLAANPPPRPTPLSLLRGVKFPLVLYIARVPGSRDVFFTPIKPREKVVTFADVQSSLYFVHVNTPFDYADEETVMSGALEPQANPRLDARGVEPINIYPPSPPQASSPSESPPMQTRPAPLPGSPPFADASGVTTPPPSLLRIHQIERKPVRPKRNARHSPGISHSSIVDLPQIPRRPVPPCPKESPWPDNSLHADNIKFLRERYNRRGIDPYSRDFSNSPETLEREERDSLPHPDTRGQLERDSRPRPETRGQLERDYRPGPKALEQLVHDSRPRPETLTLIRRDPNTGEQWNVATISDPPIDEISSTAHLASTVSAKQTKKSGTPLYLDITNPGYAHFLDEHQQVPSNDDSHHLTESRTSTSTSSSSSTNPPIDGVFLRRRLYMPGSRFADHGYGPDRHLRQPSGNDLLSPDDNNATNTNNITAKPRVDRRSKGYTFTSPWNTHCEFSTGVMGRSLKCRHTFHAPTTEAHGMVRGGEEIVQDVSELRFNLPGSSKKGWEADSDVAVAAGDGKVNGKGKRGSYFLHRREQSQGFSSPSPDALDENGLGVDGGIPKIVVDEATGRIDLSLGQEKAGGGFGGKRAKLGKLIIEPKGFEMMDLLVAANVGLWWRAYEKN